VSSESDPPATPELTAAIEAWLRLRGEARRITRKEEPAAPDLDPLSALLSMLRRSREFADRPPLPLRLVELPEQAELDLSPGLPPIDLALLRGPSPRHRRWLDTLLPSVAVGGYVVATGVFAGGRAVDLDSDDAETRQLRTFPGYFLSHPQLEATILPIADGLALGVKLRPLITERGGPF
jgi:hypothetical protein